MIEIFIDYVYVAFKHFQYLQNITLHYMQG